uniref:FAD dependent oxidoreductase domain-containing protein n=1 Tax=Moniliophthora roreri TaxID=221103 RepID=A0A0W0FEV2_MONRR
MSGEQETFLNFDRSPAIRPRPNSPRVLVIGAGIIGMSTAWTLLDRGYHVTLIAEHFATRDGKRLTSQIAGALWEYPPSVCGHTSNQTTLESSKRWAMVSYHVFKHMAADPVLAKDFSVQMRNTIFFFDKLVKDDELQLHKMREIQRSGVSGFCHDASIIHNIGISEETWKDAYQILSPLIDTDAALIEITRLVRDKGAKFVEGKRIEGDLLGQEKQLLEEYSAQAIVNATGLGAKELAQDDNVYPLRGAVLRLFNNGKRWRKINDALVVSATAEGHVETEFIFIVPRNDEILYVGGFSEPDNADLHFDENHDKVKRIAKNAKDFLNKVDPTYIDSAYPLAKGLRPARKGDVRVERELRTPNTGKWYSCIVHSYGHAGAGWSLSFGCALEVELLVAGAIAQERPVMQDKSGSQVVAKQVRAYEMSVDSSGSDQENM